MSQTEGGRNERQRQQRGYELRETEMDKETGKIDCDREMHGQTDKRKTDKRK